MAIEALELQYEGDLVTAGVAADILRDILDDPDLKDSVFWYLANSGKIKAVSSQGKNSLYLRSDVVKIAEERKEIRSLVSSAQIIDRLKERGIDIDAKQITIKLDKSNLPIAKRFGKARYYSPADAETFIESLVEQSVTAGRFASEVAGMRSPRESVAWINARLEEQGREERINLEGFYQWCARGRIKPDREIPFGKRIHRLFFFTEETLLEAPIFKVEDLPTMPDDVEPVHVTNSKKLMALQDEWGELIIRDGLREEGLSTWAVSKPDRTVKPVGYVGTVQWFPKRYIPTKLRRRKTRNDAARERGD